MPEKNKALVRQYFNEVLNKGHYDLIKELFSPSFIFSGPSQKPEHGMPTGIYDFVASARKAFPDLYMSIENEITEENQSVVIWRMTGTHQRAFRGVTPTHKYISITGMDIFTIENGRIEGMWAFFDMRSLLEQLPKKRKRTIKVKKYEKLRTSTK